MLVCATCSEYETFHTNFLLPKKRKNKHVLYEFLLCLDIFFSRLFFFSRMVHENNLISEAYLFFTINLHHSGKFQTPRMIKAVLDSKHMTIPSKVVPFIYINPISLVGNNLFQGTSVKESSKLIRTAKLIWIHFRKYTEWKSLIIHYLSVFSVNLVSLTTRGC